MYPLTAGNTVRVGALYLYRITSAERSQNLIFRGRNDKNDTFEQGCMSSRSGCEPGNIPSGSNKINDFVLWSCEMTAGFSPSSLRQECDQLSTVGCSESNKN